MPLQIRRQYVPGFSVDPAPAALPAAPYAYFGTDVVRARAVALARADRPKRFLVADIARGPSSGPADPLNSAYDPAMLACAMEIAGLLGMNVVGTGNWGDAATTSATVAAGWAITQFLHGVYVPPYTFSWNADLTPESAATWAAGLATTMQTERGQAPSQFVLFALADEPSWAYPTMISESYGLANQSAGLAQWHAWLADHGLTPGDLGGATWSDVAPALQSDAVDLPSARRYVWTMRFLTYSFSVAMQTYTTALKAAFSPALLTYVNASNYFSRWQYPETSVGADVAAGSLDWITNGTVPGSGAQWSEDWQYNFNSLDFWGITAEYLKSAALRGGTTWGGYLIGLRLDAPIPDGSLYKMLSLVGRGAKAICWYAFGPEEIWPGNGWSNNEAAYSQIAAANRLLARCEDVFYPGEPITTPIAMVYPVWAQCWDLASPYPIPTASPTYLWELIGLHHALVQMGYQVDMLSEDDVAARLGNYALCYIVSPNLAAAAQTTLAAWITAGGVAWFAPGSVVADEYNQATTTLNASRGLTAQALTRDYVEQNLTPFTVTMLAQTVNGVQLVAPGTDTYDRQTERLTVTTATVLATFDDDDSPALVAQASGAGYAISCGFWAGTRYDWNADRSGNHLTNGWVARVRTLLAAPAQVAGIAKSVTVSAELVEVLRLESAAGIGVTLLNWDDAQPIASLTAVIHNCPPIDRVVRAEDLSLLSHSQVDTDVTVTLPLATVAVLKLYPA